MSSEIEEKEYEAIAVLRDICILLYEEICRNLGRDSKYLSAAYDHLSGLEEMAEKELEEINLR